MVLSDLRPSSSSASPEKQKHLNRRRRRPRPRPDRLGQQLGLLPRTQSQGRGSSHAPARATRRFLFRPSLPPSPPVTPLASRSPVSRFVLAQRCCYLCRCLICQSTRHRPVTSFRPATSAPPSERHCRLALPPFLVRPTDPTDPPVARDPPCPIRLAFSSFMPLHLLLSVLRSLHSTTLSLCTPRHFLFWPSLPPSPPVTPLASRSPVPRISWFNAAATCAPA